MNIQNPPNYKALYRRLPFEQPRPWRDFPASYLIIAVGIIFIVLSSLSFLAAQRWLPTTANLLSELGLSGKVFAASLLSLGVFAATLGIFQARKEAQQNPLLPSDELSDLRENVATEVASHLQDQEMFIINASDPDRQQIQIIYRDQEGQTISEYDEYSESVDEALNSASARSSLGSVRFNQLRPLSLDELAERMSRQKRARTRVETIKQEIDFTDPRYADYNETDFRLAEVLFQEIELTQDIDAPPQNGSWQHAHKEESQKIDTFFHDHLKKRDQPICVYLIGNFRPEDLQIVEEALKFIRVFHGKEIIIMPKVLQMTDLKENLINQEVNYLSEPTDTEIQREKFRQELINRLEGIFPRPPQARQRIPKEQYRAEEVIQALVCYHEESPQKAAYCVALTSEHLYSCNSGGYVFGAAHYNGAGVFSNFMFGDPTESEQAFDKVLAYMMKIIGHEFGHILNLPHCVKYACNIGGYNSLQELAKSPFYYCSEDSAKICLNQGMTLKQYYTQLRTFCTQFDSTRTYPLFAQTIAHLNRKIACLENHPELYSHLP